jgi:hypothetical protein
MSQRERFEEALRVFRDGKRQSQRHGKNTNDAD